jgi:hypothetical protein
LSRETETIRRILCKPRIVAGSAFWIYDFFVVVAALPFPVFAGDCRLRQERGPSRTAKKDSGVFSVSPVMFSF